MVMSQVPGGELLGMSRQEDADAIQAAREASECCDRIATALEQAIVDAEQLGDVDMLDRLAAAKAAADRASELIRRIGDMIDAEESKRHAL
jgi:hypothetical protein